ncbi:TCP-1/cpn60 chaperonin family protein [Prosthecobacter sp.]|uniref:TCP-1/cpn60 chaperonin family protein n=1 Tax=Prosthecobacter sp. TaxID=1965333 RepID=UPI003784EC4E
MSKKPIKNIFVVMPFVRINGGSRNQEQLSAFFHNNIKRPIEGAEHLQCQYSVTRSGEDFSITREIIRSVCSADIVIADLSGTEPNPNVMYELGVRLAVSHAPVILIREDISGVKNPFDVIGYFTKFYDPLDYSKLEKHLLEKLARLETGEEKFDNEVLRVIREELTLITPDPTSISPDRQRVLVLRGIKHLADSTRVAYGPLGLGMQVRNATSSSFAITGKDIAMAVRSNNPFEHEGIRLLGHAARSIFEKYRDGSKMVILIAAAMIESVAECAGDCPGPSVAEKLSSVANVVIEQLHKCSGMAGPEQWQDLAATAAKMESVPSQLLSAIEVVTQGGIVSIEDSSVTGIQIARQEHFRLERGAVNDDFLSEDNKTLTILSDALVLVCSCSVESLKQVLPILEKVSQAQKTLLFVARGFEDEVIATLQFNNNRGALKCVPVLAPGFGERQIGILQDLAVATGANVLDPATGFSIENAGLNKLGKAKRIVITAKSTEIQDGGGDRNLIAERVGNIRSKLSGCDSDYDREQLERRMALLSGLSSTVFVGGATTDSCQLLKRQVQEAVGACLHAMQGGTIVAAASLLARLATASFGSSASSLEPAHRILMAGLEAPLRAIIRNAGKEENAALQAVRDGEIFDGRQRRLFAAGTTSLKDPVALVVEAISIAASTTSTFLRTSSWSPSSRPDDEATGGGLSGNLASLLQ